MFGYTIYRKVAFKKEWEKFADPYDSIWEALRDLKGWSLCEPFNSFRLGGVFYS